MGNRGRDFCILTGVICILTLCSAQPAMGLRITEIMYHPVEQGGTALGEERLEYVEIYNNRAVFEDLGGFKFSRGISYEFPAGTILASRQYLVIAKYPADVEAAYGITGVHGPFGGRLDNNGERLELSNDSNGIVISMRYNDSRPWPASTDGTGHSIVLARPGYNPEEGSSWVASTNLGGNPGAADEVQIEPEDPTQVTIIDDGDTGRYFATVDEEPSPGGGGVPTTAWTEITFNDNPASTGWTEGPGGFGYATGSDEQQYIRTTVNGDHWAIYVRMRFTLTADQIASFAQLSAEVAYDDGFVLYLNGQRVGDSGNITGNPPAFDESTSAAGDYAPMSVDLTGYMGELNVGLNVLAVQVNNANLGSSDLYTRAILKGTIEPEPGDGDDPRTRLLINEVLANSDAAPFTDWIELYNPGPVAVDLSNIYLSDSRLTLLEYKIPDGVVLQPGEFWAVREGTPPTGFPFGMDFSGETIYLTAATDDPVPVPIRVLDAVRYGVSEPEVTVGRFPDGSANIGYLDSATFGTANAQFAVDDIVINEIMYHHGIRDDNYAYIELYNKGASTVSLTGWSFTDGITYDFNEPVSMAPHTYLVVAKDPNTLVATYPGLVKGVNLFGPFSGSLDHFHERVQLSYPIQEINPDTSVLETYMVVTDEVSYYDGGRWPKWADGQGSSMELRDPDSDNSRPDAWADSDESGKSSWAQYSFTINGSDSTYRHDTVDIYDMMMLNRGDMLIDDLEVIINSNRISNGGFESGESPWRILGNHVQSFVSTEDKRSGSSSLHVRSTGHGDPGANRINQSISSVTASTVTFRFWARWLRGTRYILLRVANVQSPTQPPRPSHSFEIDMPLNQGTPGAQNTAFIANRGPDVAEVRHDPLLPSGGEPIVVTARITDHDGVSAVTLQYRSEGGGAFTAAAMLDNGVGNDEVAGDGIYAATIPGVNGGTMRAFYIEASDGSASSRFPTLLESSADVPDRTCLVRVGDAQVNTEFATYRIWMSDDVINTFRSRPNLSNELMDCTFIYNDSEVFYNARMRHRGSPFLRSGSNRDPRGRSGFRFDFNPDQKLGPREEINLDNTEGSNRGPLQERASYWFYRKMGLQYSTQEYIQVINSGNVHRDYEDVRKIDGDYVDSWWPGDDDGYIHKIDDYFEYNAAGTSHSNYDEGLKYDGSHPLIPETYRWGFEKRSHRENDEWGHLFDFAVAMNTPTSNPNYKDIIEAVVHPEHLAAVLALRHAVGDWDSYGYNRGKNNYFYYADEESKWYLLPWDIDFCLGSGHGTNQNLFSINSGQFPEINQFCMRSDSPYRQTYLQAFSELVFGPWQTSYGTADPPTEFDLFLDDAADALQRNGFNDSRRNPIKSFVAGRRSFILPQVPQPVFKITTNNGADFCTDQATVVIEGSVSPGVVDIWVNGSILPSTIAVSLFEVEVSVPVGAMVLYLRGVDSAGEFVGDGGDLIGVTRVLPSVITSVTPSPVCNSGVAQMTVHGSGFAPGSATLIALTIPSQETGFDAVYVPDSQPFDAIQEATLLLDNPENGVDDPTYTVHQWINLSNGGPQGEFLTGEQTFAAPYNVDSSNYAVRFTGYVYAPSTGTRYFGVNSDDGFSLWIDNQLVGEFADARGPATTDVMGNRTAGTMTFNFPAAGTYFLQLDFFENAGGEEVEFFQTNATGGDRRLLNVNAELTVFRDSAANIAISNIVVVNASTITFDADLTGAEPGMWDAVLTPECDVAGSVLQNAVEVLSCEGDVNGDMQVNFLDLAEITDKWGQSCVSPSWCDRADADHSGDVGLGDAAILADEWLTGF